MVGLILLRTPLVTPVSYTHLDVYKRQDEAHIPIRVIHGISFLEPILAALNLSSLSGVVIVDALALTKKQTPGFAPSTPALITQFHSSKALEDVKRVLMTAYPGDPVSYTHLDVYKRQILSHRQKFK